MLTFLRILIPIVFLSTSLSAQLQVVAHRGANREAPENTYAAAEVCIEMGVSYVEADVRMSADSVFFIMHDALVNRTTDGSGRLAAKKSEEIRKLDAGSWFSDMYSGEPVPELAAYLEKMKGQIGVYLDVKDGDVKKLVELIRSLEMTDEVFLYSGNRPIMEALAESAPDLHLKCNARSVKSIRRALQRFTPSIIEVRPSKCTDTIQRFCAEKNLKLMIYTTRTDEASFMELLRCGPDLVNIDDPRQFIRLREQQR